MRHERRRTQRKEVMKQKPEREPITDGKSLERFQSLLRTVANVPKAEVEKLERREQLKRQKRKAPRRKAA
jgi:hypothetical protein